MPQHDFTLLYNQFPAVIAVMTATFTSHAFIQRVARDNQGLYIAALHSYLGYPDSFRRVHAVLSKRLHTLPQLVRHLGTAASPDLFGDMVKCAHWEKV
jgi:hypothetical protein